MQSIKCLVSAAPAALLFQSAITSDRRHTVDYDEVRDVLEDDPTPDDDCDDIARGEAVMSGQRHTVQARDQIHQVLRVVFEQVSSGHDDGKCTLKVVIDAHCTLSILAMLAKGRLPEKTSVFL